MKYMHLKYDQGAESAACGEDLTNIRRATMNESRVTCVKCKLILAARKRRTGR